MGDKSPKNKNVKKPKKAAPKPGVAQPPTSRSQ